MKRWLAILLSAVMLCGTAGAESLTDQAQREVLEAFDAWQEEAWEDPARKEEITTSPHEIFDDLSAAEIEVNGVKMSYMYDIIGEPDENGLYPLYITLHGGGGGEDAWAVNTGEWATMFEYYSPSVTSGIYVACRGIEDVWNMHFLDEAFPLYERLIEDMVLLLGADPNRVYLLGFSAGGDGVYGVAPRMADRFAAVNMSSGHPNGVSLLNVANLPFEIQVGVRDFYTEDALRCVRGAEFAQTFKDYQEKYGFGYEHRVLVHVPEGHNYNDCVDPAISTVLKDPALYARRALEENWVSRFDKLYGESLGVQVLQENMLVMTLSYASEELYNEMVTALVTEEFGLETEQADANAVTYVSQFTRNPTPEHVVWDLTTRAPLRRSTSFYWLQADASVRQGLIRADFDAETNTFTLQPSDDLAGDFDILINPWLVNLDAPVRFVTPTGTFERTITPDMETLRQSLRESGDPYLTWVQKVSYTELTGA